MIELKKCSLVVKQQSLTHTWKRKCFEAYRHAVMSGITNCQFQQLKGYFTIYSCIIVFLWWSKCITLIVKTRPDPCNEWKKRQMKRVIVVCNPINHVTEKTLGKKLQCPKYHSLKVKNLFVLAFCRFLDWKHSLFILQRTLFFLPLTAWNLYWYSI